MWRLNIFVKKQAGTCKSCENLIIQKVKFTRHTTGTRGNNFLASNEYKDGTYQVSDNKQSSKRKCNMSSIRYQVWVTKY